MADKLVEAANVYNVSDKNVPHYKLKELRGTLI